MKASLSISLIYSKLKRKITHELSKKSIVEMPPYSLPLQPSKYLYSEMRDQILNMYFSVIKNLTYFR